MSQKMQRWTRFEIKILSLKELRGKPGCVNTDKALIGEFSEDTGRAITPVRAELRRAVRNCQITTGQRCVCNIISVDHLACFSSVCDFSHELFTTG